MLLSIISRLISKVVARRLRDYCEEHHIIPESQYGFRPNRSTSGPIFIMRVLMEMAGEVSPTE
eukprot:9533672-Heterocapsa_arctica.AAC.1